MSVVIIRNRIVQLQKEKNKLETSLFRERENIRKKQAEINQINKSINGSISLSTLQSKQKQIENKSKQLANYEKKAIELTNKITNKDSEILRKLNEVDKKEEQLQRRNDLEDKRRRDQSIKHSKEITKELMRQNQLHKQLSSSPITVKFEDLPQQITVLFIASNPLDQTQLRLDEEIREIQKKIRESEYRNSINFKSIWATRPTDLLQAINEYQPTIVHFSGHGSDQDELILQDDNGMTKPVRKETIVELFKFSSNKIKLVIFNTCFSENQALGIISHIPAAIGMGDSIGDIAARVFSSQLYSAIGFGKSIEDAFNQARIALMLHELPEDRTPQLFISADHAQSEIILVKPS